jgi:hypothetical protein
VDPLLYWRKLPADAFDDARREEIRSCIELLSSTEPEWQAALLGNPAAACGIVLLLRSPPEITVHVDLAMTLLLNAAFESAGAAVVLSHAINQMPIHPKLRGELSASWLVRNLHMSSGGKSAMDHIDRGRHREV